MITKAEDAGLSVEQSAGVALQENYLGDLQTVDALLRLFAMDSLQRRATDTYKPETDANYALLMADIFLGQDKDYTPIPEWNMPGKIDVWLNPKLNTQETDPRLVMGIFFVDYLVDMLRVTKYACDALPEQWQPQITGTIEHYRNLLLGIDDVEME